MKAAAQATQQKPRQSVLPPKRPTRAKVILLFLATGLAVAMAGLLLKFGLEETPLGHYVEYQTYVQLSKSNAFRPEPGVVVVDISTVPGGELDQQTKKVVPTPRKPLFEIVRAVVAAGARGVFVDIDLSPDRDGYLVPAEDPEFLEKCWNLSAESKVPIRLGVYRTMLSDEATWLGYHRYAPMAAALWLPEGEPRHLPTAFYPEAASNRRLPALGAAFQPRASAKRDWRDLIGTKVKREPELQINADTVMQADITNVDYSIIPQLVRESQPIEDAKGVKPIAAKLKDQLVFIGSLAAGRDAFPVPGTTERRPGVLLHAALAYTLDKAPLWEARPGSRVAVDFVLSLLALLALLAAGVHNVKSEGHKRDIQGDVLLGAFLVIVVLGFVAIHVARVLWSDAVIAGLLLLWHPRIERMLNSSKLLQLVSRRSSHE